MASKEKIGGTKKKIEDALLDIVRSTTPRDPRNILADRLYDSISTNVDEDHIRQYLLNHRDEFEQLQEIASMPVFIDVTTNPRVLEKDHGFEEKDSFYSQDPSNPKSWLNRSVPQLRANAEKYGMSLSEYLNNVRELSEKKERERQWKEGGTIAEKNLPVLGQTRIPRLARALLPISFEKAAADRDVDYGDVVADMGLNLAEYGLLRGGRGMVGAILGAPARNFVTQSTLIDQGIQPGYDPLDLGTSAALGIFGGRKILKGTGDLLKGLPGAQGMKQVRKAANTIEDLGEAEKVQKMGRLGRILSKGREPLDVTARVVGGRWGIGPVDEDLRELGNKIINSEDWSNYVRGLPHNLTQRDIWIATQYADKDPSEKK